MSLSLRHECPCCEAHIATPMLRSTVPCRHCGAEVAFAPMFLGNTKAILLYVAGAFWLGMQLTSFLDDAPIGRLPVMRTVVDLAVSGVWFLLCRYGFSLFQQAVIAEQRTPQLNSRNVALSSSKGISPNHEHSRRGQATGESS